MLMGYLDCAVAAEPAAEPEEQEFSRFYTTREERREAGKEHVLTDWLLFRGLSELEWLGESLKTDASPGSFSQDELVLTLQLGIEATASDWLSGEVILEYDSEVDDVLLDEAILKLELENWEVEAGSIFVNFGEYFSHFATGPILEFAETKGEPGLIVSYGFGDALDLSVFAYDGLSRRAGDSPEEEPGWGLAIEGAIGDSGSYGVSYISNLADAEEELLEEFDNQYINPVDALSAYLVAGFGEYELTAEFVAALVTFDELESGFRRPSAWNIELAGYPSRSFSWALRLEGSRQLVDAPTIQGGISGTWRIWESAYLSVDYLYGKFSKESYEIDDDVFAAHRHQVGVLLFIEF